VYEYKITLYNCQTNDGSLFVDYINTFLKLKAEASGYPSWVRSPEDDGPYIHCFRESVEIELDKASIKYNAAKQGFSKRCINSMWGKLSDRNNRTPTKLISDPKDLYRFLETPSIEVINITFANDDVFSVSWTFTAEERVPSLRHTNEVIGAYVTAGARIYLYRHLDTLQENVIYCDTNTFIFIQPMRRNPAG